MAIYCIGTWIVETWIPIYRCAVILSTALVLTRRLPAPPPPSGQQPAGPGELGDGPPLGQRLALRQAPREGGHGAAAEEPDARPAAEDRHGQQDEENGRAAAIRRQRPQEQEGHREPGEDPAPFPPLLASSFEILTLGEGFTMNTFLLLFICYLADTFIQSNLQLIRLSGC